MLEFRSLTERTTFNRGEGLPGRVWASGEPAWIVDVVADARFTRARKYQILQEFANRRAAALALKVK
jgi:hypothetical protein